MDTFYINDQHIEVNIQMVNLLEALHVQKKMFKLFCFGLKFNIYSNLHLIK